MTHDIRRITYQHVNVYVTKEYGDTVNVSMFDKGFNNLGS